MVAVVVGVVGDAGGACGGRVVAGVFARFVAQLAAFARLEAAEGAAQEWQQFGEVFRRECAQPVVEDVP